MSLQKLKDFNLKFTPEYIKALEATMGSFSNEVIKAQLIQSLKIAKNGKKIRPFLVSLMDNPTNYDSHTPIYQSLELIHLFALVHDDIMDECNVRRGETTVHAHSRQFYPNQEPSKQSRITESIAILAGDMIFSFAEKRFQDVLSFIEKEKWQRAYSYFNQLKEEVIYGQLLDLHLTSKNHASENEVYDKTFYKTASYTIIKPMQIGCILGDREDLIQFCHDFGEPLGVAFQIQDDYLNLTQTEEETGKPQFTDILENQKTEFFLELQANPDHLSKIEPFINKESLSKEEQQELGQILKQSGVLQKGKSKFEQLYSQAQEVLEKNRSILPQETYETLQGLTDYLVNRTN